MLVSPPLKPAASFMAQMIPVVAGTSVQVADPRLTNLVARRIVDLLQEDRAVPALSFSTAFISELQEALRVTVGDPLPVGWAYRQLFEEAARGFHRGKRVIGREHDPFYPNLEQQVEERRCPVEPAERVADVLT